MNINLKGNNMLHVNGVYRVEDSIWNVCLEWRKYQRFMEQVGFIQVTVGDSSEGEGNRYDRSVLNWKELLFAPRFLSCLF